MATSATAYASATQLEDILARLEEGQEPSPLFIGPLKTGSTWARRRDDLLSIRLDFYDLVLDSSDPANPRLVRIPGKRAYIVAVFWPQNVAEEAFAEPGPAPPEPPVQTILSRETRLAFEVPPGVDSIPYRLDELLRWTALKPSVVPNAGLNGSRSITTLTAPGPVETALELPWRLVLSTHEESRWKHALAPVTHDGRTELWHTRLVVGPDMELDEPDPAKRTLRAVWTRDPKFPNYLADSPSGRPPPGNPDPFRMSMDGAGANSENNRFDIVMNSAVEIVVLNPKPPHKPITIYSPAPIKVDRLMLTALGAWTDVEGHWEGATKPRDSKLVEWRHRGTMGRDHYVKIVRRGFVYPYGHPAVLVTITERKFNFSGAGTLGAYLRQRTFLVITRPDKRYSSAKAGPLAPQQPYEGRMTPFRRIRITTLVTPPITNVDNLNPFKPEIAPGEPLLLHAIGTDWGGMESEFTTTFFFVAEDFAEKQSKVDPLLVQTVTADLFGQRVNIAETDELRKGDVGQEVKAITFGANPPTGGTSDANLKALVLLEQPGFYPSVAEAEIRMVAAEQASGGTFTGTVIQIAPPYRDFGFDTTKNRGQVYAELKSPPAPVSFPPNKSGGVMTPNLNISGLSRILGPVADHANIAAGQFKPEQVFTNAKLMGGLKLADIVKTVSLVTPTAASNGAPQDIITPKDPPQPFQDDDNDDDDNTKALKITINQIFEDGGDKPATAIETKVKWKPDLKKDPLHIFEPEAKTKAVLKVRIRQDLKDKNRTDLEVKGKIEDFKLNLFGDQGGFHILSFQFTKFEFTAATGSGLDVKPEIGKVTFHGILQFVEKLKDLMSKFGSGGPVGFAVTPELIPPAVKATLSITIPDPPPVGVFAISNMKFSFITTIPFTDKPIRFRFEFCNRDHPFLIRVYIFGGGGFFGIALGTDGFEMLEAALEFGAAANLNLGVASGSASIMAGIYFKLEEEKPANKQKTSLQGYFRANGELSVLGIVNVSIELYMSLTYEFETRKVTGVAKLSISVSVLFFSISVELKVERKFGGEGDPSFVDMHNQGSWDEYADTFAA